MSKGLIFLLILAGAGVIYAGIVMQRVYHFTKISSGLVAENQPFSFHPADPNLHILVIGDSLAAGIGASAEDSLAGRLHEEYPDADITNAGVSGAKLADILATAEALPNGQQFDMILLIGGANDIVRFTSLSAASASLEQLLARLTALSPHVVMLTSGNIGGSPIFWPPLSWIYSARSKRFLPRFSQIATEHGVEWINLLFPLPDDPLLKDIPANFAPDMFHPSGAGYGEWYSILQQRLPKEDSSSQDLSPSQTLQ